MKKVIWVAAFLFCTFVVSFAARKGKSEIVIRETADGWRMFVFGPGCQGTLTVINPTDSTQPIQVVCREGARN